MTVEDSRNWARERAREIARTVLMSSDDGLIERLSACLIKARKDTLVLAADMVESMAQRHEVPYAGSRLRALAERL